MPSITLDTFTIGGTNMKTLGNSIFVYYGQEPVVIGFTLAGIGGGDEWSRVRGYLGYFASSVWYQQFIIGDGVSLENGTNQYPWVNGSYTYSTDDVEPNWFKGNWKNCFLNWSTGNSNYLKLYADSGIPV